MTHKNMSDRVDALEERMDRLIKLHNQLGRRFWKMSTSGLPDGWEKQFKGDPDGFERMKGEEGDTS